MFNSILNDKGINLLHIFYDLITGRASAQLYYILVLVEFTFLTPLLMSALGSKKWSVFIISITPIYLLLCSGYRYYTGAELSWMGRDFCAWMIFYYSGMVVKHYGWKQRSNGPLVQMYFLALAVSIAEGFVVNFKLGMFSMAIGQINLTTMLHSLTVIALIMNYWPGSKGKVLLPEKKEIGKVNLLKMKFIQSLIYIGDISFGIYFCHTFVLRCVSFALREAGVMEIFALPLIQLLQFFLALLCSVIGIYIFQHIDKNRKLCPYIGF